MKQPNPSYFFSPTLLDAFQNYLDAPSQWDKFYGDMEEDNEKYISISDYEEKSYKELIDKINRVKHEPIEAAAKGTAFNDIVDTLVHNRNCGHTILQRIYDNDDNRQIVGIQADIDGFTFMFDKNTCYNAAAYFGMQYENNGVIVNSNPSDKCLSQVLVESNIETRYGIVNLYGFIDEMRMDVVYDIKTTTRYEFGKYNKYNQRFVYPYCLIESGLAQEINSFEFTVFVLSGGNSRTPLITGKQYREVYNYDHELAKLHIKSICERFIEFIIANRHLITDNNIFKKHSHNH